MFSADRHSRFLLDTPAGPGAAARLNTPITGYSSPAAIDWLGLRASTNRKLMQGNRLEGKQGINFAAEPSQPPYPARAAVNSRKIPDWPVTAAERRRTFIDLEGVQWDVYEIRNPDYDRRSGQSLIFESVGAMRRVRNYPADWMQRSTDELIRLSVGK